MARPKRTGGGYCKIHIYRKGGVHFFWNIISSRGGESVMYGTLPTTGSFYFISLQ